MKRNRLHSGLATLAVLIFAGVAWFYFAPTNDRRIDPLRGHERGQHGAALPHGRSRDRAARRELPGRRDRRVLEHAAPHRGASPHHRQGRQRYVFKGDNNHFIDPARPTRSELLGKLWLHLPHAGRVLDMLHTPVAAALLCAVVGLLTLFGLKESKRRRRRRRKGANGSGRPGIPIVNSPRDTTPFQLRCAPHRVGCGRRGVSRCWA